MTEFNEKYGIMLDEEEKSMFKRCASFVSEPTKKGKEQLSTIPNLREALNENLVGWEIKQ